MDFLLDNGYAVFDANVLPASSDLKGRANGSPLYVNVLKNAYDYIQANYNVYREIFAHGTSMGGLGASAFANAYPGIVLAESSFAGRDIIQYITRLKAGTYDDSLELAVPWGYNDTAALKSDKWSHIVGAAPSMSLVKYTNGVAAFAPDRELNFSDWLTWYADVYSYGRNSEPTWKGCAKRIIPYKAWDSWADKETGESESTLMRAKLILRDAFTRGSSVPYEVVVYEDYTHTDLSYGKVVHDESDDISMRYELVAWFKRWE